MQKKNKNGKAAGKVEITNKVWKYGREEIEKWVWNFYNTV